MFPNLGFPPTDRDESSPRHTTPPPKPAAKAEKRAFKVPPLHVRVMSSQQMIEMNFPGLTEFKTIADVTIGTPLPHARGVSILYNGLYRDIPIILKFTPINDENIVQFKEYYSILTVLRTIPGALTPFLVAYEENATPGNIASFVEASYKCLDFSFAPSPELLKNQILHIIQTLIALHEAGIAHLDFKIENLVLRPRADSAVEPALIDFAESRFLRGVDQRALVTTSSIIAHSPAVNEILNLHFSGCDHGMLNIIDCIVNKSRRGSAYVFIDQIMFGIFIADNLSHIPVYHMLGKKLIASAFCALTPPCIQAAYAPAVCRLPRVAPMTSRQRLTQSSFADIEELGSLPPRCISAQAVRHLQSYEPKISTLRDAFYFLSKHK